MFWEMYCALCRGFVIVFFDDVSTLTHEWLSCVTVSAPSVSQARRNQHVFDWALFSDWLPCSVDTDLALAPLCFFHWRGWLAYTCDQVGVSAALRISPSIGCFPPSVNRSHCFCQSLDLARLLSQ